jgi:hypothetical protein
LHKSKADRAADIHRENMKKKRRELEQASLDAASDLLDTDSNATFAMVIYHSEKFIYLQENFSTLKLMELINFRNHWCDIQAIH